MKNIKHKNKKNFDLKREIIFFCFIKGNFILREQKYNKKNIYTFQ